MSHHTKPHESRYIGTRAALATAVSLMLSAPVQAQTSVGTASPSPAPSASEQVATRQVLPPVYFTTQLPKPSGRYAVGYLSTVMVDHSRVDPLYPQPEQQTTGQTDQPRRLPVSFWYPAAPNLAPMRDYIPDVREEEIAISLGQPGLVGAAVYLKTNTRDNAPIPVGKFPLLIFSPGFGFPAEFYQAYAEQLASSGFIVAAVNSPGINGFLTVDGRGYPSPEDVPEELENIVALNTVMTEDLVSVLKLIRNGEGMPSLRLFRAIDFERIGAYGHSFGASAALRLAARDKGVKAVAGLDGTIWGEDHVSGIETNALFVTTPESIQDPTMTLAYERLKGRAIFCQQMDALHMGLSDLYFINRTFSGPSADLGGPDVGARPLLNIALTRQLLSLYFGVELQGRPVKPLTDFFKLLPARQNRPGFTSKTKGF